MTLDQELTNLSRLFQDATREYYDAIRKAGNEDLSNEWRWNVGDLLNDAWQIGKVLSEVYAAPPGEVLPAMRRFLEQALTLPEVHTRGIATRLKDVVEGRPPSWPGEVT